MRLQLILLELTLALFLSFSNGARVKSPYSKEEDKLIIEQVESHANLYNHKIWNVVAKAHENKFNDNAPGFSKKRSADAIRKHFSLIVKKNDIDLSDTVKLLHEKYLCKPYSEEEDELINTELRSYHRNLYSDAIWEEMKKKHDERREARYPGFSNKRTVEGLRLHFINGMSRKDKVDEVIKQRFPHYFKPTRGSSSTGRANQSDAGTKKNVHQYTQQETNLIIKMLECHASQYMYDRNIWKEIAKVHKSKLEDNDAGFIRPRTATALYRHFLLDIMKNPDIEVPDIVKQLYHDQMNKDYRVKEHEFINKELCSFDGKLFRKEIWKEIARRHDRKRESRCPGFVHKRTWRSLRGHFRKGMIPKNLVDRAVKLRFPDYFEIEQEEEQPVTLPRECSAEHYRDQEVWVTILEDLEKSQRSSAKFTKVDDFGVDHTLFLDRMAIRDNDIFDQYSPYELRTFEPMSP